MSAVLANNILTNEAVEMRKRLIQSIVQQDLKKTRTHRIWMILFNALLMVQRTVSEIVEV